MLRQRRRRPRLRAVRAAAADLMRAPYRVDRDYRRVERARRGAGAVLCRTAGRARADRPQPRAAGRDRGGLPRRRRHASRAPRSMSPTAPRWRPGSAEFDRAHPVELLIANAGISAGPDPDSPGEPAATTWRQIEVNLRRRRQHDRAAGAGDVRARPRPDRRDRLGRGVSRPALQPGLLRQQGRAARLCRGAAPAPGAARGRGDGGVSRIFLVADDRPLGRADAVSRQRRAGRPAHQARHRPRPRARIDFPWPLVLGMRFCDLAPAAIGDAILRGFRFRIRSA